MRPDLPRPLSTNERALIDGFLAHDFAGVRELREQADHLRATKGCECGCGTIDLVVEGRDVPRSEVTGMVPVGADVTSPDGGGVGEMILFVRDGLLWSLEVYAYRDDSLPLPRPEQVTWWSWADEYAARST